MLDGEEEEEEEVAEPEVENEEETEFKSKNESFCPETVVILKKLNQKSLYKPQVEAFYRSIRLDVYVCDSSQKDLYENIENLMINIERVPPIHNSRMADPTTTWKKCRLSPRNTFPTTPVSMPVLPKPRRRGPRRNRKEPPNQKREERMCCRNSWLI